MKLRQRKNKRTRQGLGQCVTCNGRGPASMLDKNRECPTCSFAEHYDRADPIVQTILGEAIDRMADALTEYRQLNPVPADANRQINRLSVKYQIGVKTIKTALLMEAGGINSGKGLK